MKHIISRSFLLSLSAMLFLTSAGIPHTVLAEESSPYGEIEGDPVISEIPLRASEMTAPETEENGKEVTADSSEIIRVIVELEEPGVLEAGLDPAKAEGRAYAQRLIREQTESHAAVQQMSTSQIQRKPEGEEASFRHFTNVMNGYVTEIPRSIIPLVQKTAGVKRVFEDVSRQLPEVTVSKDDASQTDAGIRLAGAYASGYTGEGLLVGILDSGLDLNHPAFAKEPLSGRITEETVFEGTHAENSWMNAKVPFAWDYADLDNDVIPAGTDSVASHGTHIAGVIAGNDEIIQGVAPDAQLAFFKISSDSRDWVFDSVIISALEDAVIVKPDVINLSFGSAGGDDGSSAYAEFESEMQTMKEIYDRIYESGVMISAAAGNNGHMGGSNMNAAYNAPHIGLVDSPSTYEPSLSVGSIYGTKLENYSFQLRGIYNEYPFVDPCAFSENSFASLLENGPLEYIDCGKGTDEDFENAGVEGKLALAEYGGISVRDKQKNAAEANAAGLIVYHNTKGSVPSLNTDPSSIPVIAVSRAVGLAMLNAGQKAITSVTVDFSRENPYSGRISTFSSWGTTDDLRIKPEIMAPGQRIFSSVIGGYELMDGTSMAAPHVTAALAAAKKRAEDLGLTQSERELSDIAIRLLMSTASPIVTGGSVSSVRESGAGLMDLNSALNTKAYLSVEETEGKRPKIELGDDPERSGVYPLNFRVTNISDTELQYDIEIICGTGAGGSSLQPLNFEINGDTSVIIGPGQTVSVSLVLQLSDEGKAVLDDNYACGGFVEGYVCLNPGEQNDDTIQLSLPYIAYYGDWEDHPLLDVSAENGSQATAGMSAAVSYSAYADMLEDTGGYFCPVIGMNPYDSSVYDPYTYYRDVEAEYSLTSSLIHPAFEGYTDEIRVLDRTKNTGIYSATAGLYKNVDGYGIRIYDADSGEVYFEKEETGYFRKAGAQTSNNRWADFKAAWAGTDASGEPLPDGTHVIMEISVTKGEKTESQNVPVTIDNEKPYIIGSTPSEDDSGITPFTGVRLAVTAGGRKYLKFEAADNNHVAYVQIGTGIETIEYHPAEETGDESLSALVYTGYRVVNDRCTDESEYTKVFLPHEAEEQAGVMMDVSDYPEDRWYVCVADYAGLKTYYEVSAETTEPFTIKIDPAERAVLMNGRLQTLTYRVTDQDGYEIDGSSLKWTLSGNTSFSTMFMASMQRLLIAPNEASEKLTLRVSDPADPSVNAEAVIYLITPDQIALTLNPENAMIKAGSSLQLNAEIQPEAAKLFGLQWNSSDETIASVNENGLVSGLKAGKAVITASLAGISAQSECMILFRDAADPSSYYFNPVYWALENDITTGTAPDLFSPKDKVTRGQTVTFLYRIAGEPEVSEGETFTDVDPDKYYAKAVYWALANGITTGYADGSGRFGPDDKCTREQFVTFLWRFAGRPVPAETKMFTDEKAGAYYVDAISWAAEKGVTVGLDDGTGRFGIGMGCSRAMAVTFLSRFCSVSQ